MRYAQITLNAEELTTVLIAIHRYRRDTHCSEPRAKAVGQMIPALQGAFKRATYQQRMDSTDIALWGN